MTNFRFTLRVVFSSLLLSFLAATSPIMAQPGDYYRSTADSTKGYWRLQTDYSTRSTIIQFFNNQRELIYRETLAGRYVKLTKRNVRMFNAMLDELVNSRLLDTRLKSHDLVATNSAHFTPSSADADRFPVEAAPIAEETTLFMAASTVSKTGQLRINFTNFDQKKVFILLSDSAQTTYYTERTRLPAYIRDLDITQLSSGSYTLLIKHEKHSLNYQLSVDQASHFYQLKPILSGP